MKNRKNTTDNYFFILLVEIAVSIGWLIFFYYWGMHYQQQVLFLLAAVILLFLWHVYHIMILMQWLQMLNKKNFPETLGIWQYIYRQIYHQQQDQRFLQKRLSKSEKNHLQFVDALPDAIIIVRQHDEIIWFNQKAAELFKLGKKHLGKSLLSEISLPLEALIQNRNSNNRKITAAPYHSELTLSLRYIPYSRDYQLLYARDISRLNNMLKSQKDFIANISHELKTPLTVVLGYMEVLYQQATKALKNTQDSKNKEKSSQEREIFFAILQQSKRMQSLISDLLLLSRLESEQPSFSMRLLRLCDLIEQSIADNQYLIDSKKLHVIVDMKDESTIMGDKTQVLMLIGNLLRNAIQYTDAEGTIEIHCYRLKKRLCFSIKDNGPGIDKKHIPRLTERFYRIDKARSREQGGTGLGLAIVKQIADNHHASLQIQSKKNKGSKFGCCFPRA